MFRRTRRVREIPFSFDSFLDVVANVVGIIIRLILVVWVGARSYSSVQTLAKPDQPDASLNTPGSVPNDPMQLELARHRQELEQVQARLLELLRDVEETRQQQQGIDGQLSRVTARRTILEQEQAGLERVSADQEKNYRGAECSLAELGQRRRKLAEEIREFEQLAPRKKVLRYRTPVSRPVHTEEFLFECRQGRVTFIDIASLREEVLRGLKDKAPLLRERWQVEDSTLSVGAFRLRYLVERERELTDTLIDTSPDGQRNFHYGLTRAVLEPVLPVRGESLAEALAPGSQFRQVGDAIDPELAVVTCWIYPDSFALFRQLRDYLYERNIVVAGRPLPDGTPIAFGRNGSISRGQ